MPRTIYTATSHSHDTSTYGDSINEETIYNNTTSTFIHLRTTYTSKSLRKTMLFTHTECTS